MPEGHSIPLPLLASDKKAGAQEHKRAGAQRTKQLTSSRVEWRELRLGLEAGRALRTSPHATARLVELHEAQPSQPPAAAQLKSRTTRLAQTAPPVTQWRARAAPCAARKLLIATGLCLYVYVHDYVGLFSRFTCGMPFLPL